MILFDIIKKLNDKLKYKPDPPELKLYPKINWRMMASIFDVLLILLIVSPLMPYMEKVPQQVAGLQMQAQQGEIDDKTYVLAMLNYLIHGGWFVLLMDLSGQYLLAGVLVLAFWFWRSATPGKMLLRIEIVNATDFGKPTRKQFIKRYLGYVFSAVFFGLGFLWIMFDKRRQGWHDHFSNTLVVFKHRKPKA